jgi:N-acylneuraminate cytidylyltransferase/CMP-N,N'-diacetyllegionaminic acid synthase
LPGKNLRCLGGVPLITWTARTIETAGLSGRAVLSTDDPAIAEVGRAAGLEAPFLRPAERATDETPMVSVVEHAIEWMEREAGYSVSTIMLLQPTNPFRRAQRLHEALELFARPGTEAVIGVDTIARTPGLLYRRDADGLLVPLGAWEERVRRQDVQPVLTPNGTLYLITRESFQRTGRMFPPRLLGLSTDRIEGIDIDTPEDWALAEAVVAAGLVKL